MKEIPTLLEAVNDNQSDFSTSFLAGREESDEQELHWIPHSPPGRSSTNSIVYDTPINVMTKRITPDDDTISVLTEPIQLQRPPPPPPSFARRFLGMAGCLQDADDLLESYKTGLSFVRYRKTNASARQSGYRFRDKQDRLGQDIFLLRGEGGSDIFAGLESMDNDDLDEYTDYNGEFDDGEEEEEEEFDDESGDEEDDDDDEDDDIGE